MCARWQWNTWDCVTGLHDRRSRVQSSNTSQVRFTVISHTPVRSRFYHTHTVEPLWKGQESLTKVAKFGQFQCTILYKSCLFYPSWQATSFERPSFWMAFIEGFHCIMYQRIWDASCLVNLTYFPLCFLKFSIWFIVLMTLGETCHLKRRDMVTVWRMMLLLCCYYCDCILMSCRLNTYCDVTQCMNGLWIIITKLESPKGDSQT